MSNSYDPIDTCPYDPVHRIMRSRMQYHLTKCSKNWPCSKKKQCPYDARHVVNQIEFNYHVSICPQRESVWHYKDKLEENEKVEDPLGILPIDPSPVVAPADDIWEEEGNVQSYDPIKYTENKLVTRILIGAPKSQRKKHRIQERLRISRLVDDAPKKEKDSATQSKNNQHAASTIKPSTLKEASVEAKRVYEPLRSPKELPIDTSNIPKIPTINDSTVVDQMQNFVSQNEPLQFVQEKSNINDDFDPQTTFSYAAAAKNVTTQRERYNSIESDYDIIESKQCDIEKENNYSSVFNRNKEDFNLQTKCSYAAAAKNVLTNQRQQFSSIESDYDVIERKQCDTEKENDNSSLLNKNKAFDLQASTFSYADAAKIAFANQQYSYIESDYDFLESKKWNTEKEDNYNNNSAFSNKNKDVDLPTTAISYAAAAKIVPTFQRRQNNSIESIKVDTKKDNNSLLTNRNKEIFDRQNTFNYSTAAAKYVPPHLRHKNSNVESDSDVAQSIKCDAEKENNNSLLTNRNKEDLDVQTIFNYETENIPIIRRPRNRSVESDCDIIIESIKYNSEKENNSSFFNRNKEDFDIQTTTFNYATDAENVPTIRRPRNSSIESDCDIISESTKCATEKDNSSFFNRNKEDLDMQTTFSYATAAKNLSTNQRPRNSSIESDSDFIIEGIKCSTEKENNSSFVNKNKEYLDPQATTFNYAAATKYVPLNQRQLNSSIEGDYNLQTTKFNYAIATENVLTNQPQRKSSIESNYDMHTASLFRYATAAKNALINRRPRIKSTESDCDMVIESINYDTDQEYNSSFFNNAIDENFVKLTKTIKTLSVDDEGRKVQSDSLDRTLKSLNRTTDYSSITNHGLNRININKPVISDKKTSRCAANLHFTNLRQYLQNTK